MWQMLLKQVFKIVFQSDSSERHMQYRLIKLHVSSCLLYLTYGPRVPKTELLTFLKLHDLGLYKMLRKAS